MLFGLNSCISIGGHIHNDYFRYSVIVDNKERFGKLPIIRKSYKKNKV